MIEKTNAEFDWRPFNAYESGVGRKKKGIPPEGKLFLFKMASGYFFLGARSGGMVIPVSEHNRPVPLAQIVEISCDPNKKRL